MPAAEVVLPIRRFMAEHVTLRVRVRGLRLARVRLTLAVAIVWFAAKVAGTGFHVDVDDNGTL